MVALAPGSSEPTAQMSDGDRPAIAARSLSLEPMLGVGTWCHLAAAELGATAAGRKAARCAVTASGRDARTGASDAAPNSFAIGTTCLVSQVKLRQPRPNACWIVASSE